MSDGGYKDIEDIKVGDLVKSFDLKNQEITSSQVKGISEQKEIGYLVINNTLKLTKTHTIYLNNKFQRAENIKLGDIILNEEGRNVLVFSIEFFDEEVNTYDLSVSCDSNFFVGGYLVHNSPGDCTGSTNCSPGGACNYACDSGYYNCDGNNSNGCESDAPCDITSATGTGNIIVSNNFTISANATFIAPATASFTVAGNWSNSGTFIHSNGTITFNDSSKITTLSGTTTFYNLTSNTPSKNLVFTVGTTQTIASGGTLTLNGGACGTMISIHSSAGGTQWNINVASGASANLNFVYIQDSNATGNTIIAYNSKNADNNTNWIISGGTCFQSPVLKGGIRLKGGAALK